MKFGISRDIINVLWESLKISKLFDWQFECFTQQSVQDGCKLLRFFKVNLENLIYSAPTSGGKTLVSELIMLRNLLNYPTLKALIIMPYVSLIAEKEAKIKQLIEPLNMRIQSIHSHRSKNFYDHLIRSHYSWRVKCCDLHNRKGQLAY